jgi:glutathione S-transferase
VSDPQLGNRVPVPYPPKPPGSLPILVIPRHDISHGTGGTKAGEDEPVYIRQSLAIMSYLDELCDSGEHGFPQSAYPMRGADTLERARVSELLLLADECTSMWNPVRTFGSGAGTMNKPAAVKEMFRWVHQALVTIETWLGECPELLSAARVTMADIVLCQFLEFIVDCYGIDMTKSASAGQETVDLYNRQVVFPNLRQFFEAFKVRPSARRDTEAGQVPRKEMLTKKVTWVEDVLQDG